MSKKYGAEVNYADYTKAASKRHELKVKGRLLTAREHLSIERKMLEGFNPSKFKNKKEAKQHMIQRMALSGLFAGLIIKVLVSFLANLLVRRFYSK